MTIMYCDKDDFYEGILECVKRGLTFKASYNLLTIELQAVS